MVYHNDGNIISGNSFGDHTVIIGTGTANISQNAASTSQDDAILKELQGIQEKLAQTEPMASRVVGELRDAIREHDQPKISSTIRDLTTGTIGSVIAELASAALKKFLGLP